MGGWGELQKCDQVCSAVWISITITCVCDVIIKAGMCGKGIKYIMRKLFSALQTNSTDPEQLKFGAPPPPPNKQTEN